MRETHHFTRVSFHRFKAFEKFSLHLRAFNILVGPNNAGKSTVLAAFRILASGMRRATARKPDLLTGPEGTTLGHRVDLSAISVAEENLFWNYNDSEPAAVTFYLSNGNKILLYFPQQGACHMIPIDSLRSIGSPALFKSRFKCQIAFVPILGPVEHNERLYEKEAARRALFNYRAARNFRNIWYHYRDQFTEFRDLVRETWPGMDIERPTVALIDAKPILHMFCPEDRIPREIFWAGFGFQVWCQMLTHIVQSRSAAIFLIDEPDIYLHADLQRQLVALLRNLGPDILIATHSTEIVTEADKDEIVLIDKNRISARRIKEQEDLVDVFTNLGSDFNPILTQVAKTRRVVFVEGKDFQILGKLARKLRFFDVANRSQFAVVPVEGFNPDRIRSLKRGIEVTLGGKIASCAIFDRDFRSVEECEFIKEECSDTCDLVIVHSCKEVENFLLVPDALNRAAERRIEERNRRTGEQVTFGSDLSLTLVDFARKQRSYAMSQYIDFRQRFARSRTSKEHPTSISQSALQEFEVEWAEESRKIAIVPGKQALSYVNRHLQENYSISITPTGVIQAMRRSEIPKEVESLLVKLKEFTLS